MKRTFRKTNVMVSWGYRLVNDPGLGEFGLMEWLGLHMNLVLYLAASLSKLIAK